MVQKLESVEKRKKFLKKMKRTLFWESFWLLPAEQENRERNVLCKPWSKYRSLSLSLQTSLLGLPLWNLTTLASSPSLGLHLLFQKIQVGRGRERVQTCWGVDFSLKSKSSYLAYHADFLSVCVGTATACLIPGLLGSVLKLPIEYMQL